LFSAKYHSPNPIRDRANHENDQASNPHRKPPVARVFGHADHFPVFRRVELAALVDGWGHRTNSPRYLPLSPSSWFALRSRCFCCAARASSRAGHEASHAARAASRADHEAAREAAHEAARADHEAAHEARASSRAAASSSSDALPLSQADFTFSALIDRGSASSTSFRAFRAHHTANSCRDCGRIRHRYRLAMRSTQLVVTLVNISPNFDATQHHSTRVTERIHDAPRAMQATLAAPRFTVHGKNAPSNDLAAIAVAQAAVILGEVPAENAMIFVHRQSPRLAAPADTPPPPGRSEIAAGPERTKQPSAPPRARAGPRWVGGLCNDTQKPARESTVSRSTGQQEEGKGEKNARPGAIMHRAELGDTTVRRVSMATSCAALIFNLFSCDPMPQFCAVFEVCQMRNSVFS
jgi:hypothetical protein